MIHHDAKFKGYRRPTLDRRSFLQVVGLSGAGFMVGCGRQDFPGDSGSQRQMVEMGPFIRIGSDNTVTVVIKHLDKGQGVTTGLPTIVAEELDADWSQMKSEFAPADADKYNNLFWGQMQGTGGSSSIANSWPQLREAAATARAMLVGAAAVKWKIEPGEINVRNGVLVHAPSGRSATFGELAESAADISPASPPRLKRPEEFSLIGTRVKRLDSVAKTDGSCTFTMDVDLPGMSTALVAHPPKFGATVKTFNADKSLAIRGVVEVVEMPHGIAVIADSYWSAKQGRDSLEIEWDYSEAELRGSEELFKEYREELDVPGIVARDEGDVVTALAGSDLSISSEFQFPYLSHATMEPMNCVVDVGSGGCKIWTGSQFQTTDQQVAAEILGLQPEQVDIHTLFAGGSFGRRAVPDSDYVAEAVKIAKAASHQGPIKLVWTREDDLHGGRYRPMSYHRLEGGIDAAGNVTAWRHKLVTQSILRGTMFDSSSVSGVDNTSVEGAADLPYAIPNLHVEVRNAENGVPILWWRSVGHSHNAFVTDVFLDELAGAAGHDPYEIRRKLLADHPRHLAVLDLVAEKSGWGESTGTGRGRGIAIHETHGTVVAHVVDVTVSDSSFSVDRVVCAVDCGIAVNPDVIKAQMEGGIAFALSAALREEVTLDEGAVQQSNFGDYQPLRIDEMPQVAVHILSSAQAPTGVGEPGVSPLAPALANALFDATGKRIRRLPIRNQLRT